MVVRGYHRLLLFVFWKNMGGFVIGGSVYCRRGRPLDALRSDSVVKLCDVARHGKGDVALFPIDIYRHSEVFATIPVDLTV